MAIMTDEMAALCQTNWRAFTLVEMMVVVGIIAVLVSVSLPAFGPMLASNKEAQVLNTLDELLTNAQATACQLRTSVALRVERAFKTNDLGLMVDAAGKTTLDPAFTQPIWLDYQQVRLVTLAAGRNQVFSQTRDTKVYELPKNFWLAPDYALRTDWPSGIPANAIPGNLSDNSLRMPQQVIATGGQAAAFNRIENFYIVFNPAGDMVRYPAVNLVYADQAQQYLAGTVFTSPWITHPDPSARAVFLYNRRQWNEIPPTNGADRTNLLKASRPVNINRATGTIVAERT